MISQDKLVSRENFPDLLLTPENDGLEAVEEVSLALNFTIYMLQPTLCTLYSDDNMFDMILHVHCSHSYVDMPGPDP